MWPIRSAHGWRWRKGTGSHMHAFGIDWDNTSGKNNGHFASFHWQG